MLTATAAQLNKDFGRLDSRNYTAGSAEEQTAANAHVVLGLVATLLAALHQTTQRLDYNLYIGLNPYGPTDDERRKWLATIDAHDAEKTFMIFELIYSESSRAIGRVRAKITHQLLEFWTTPETADPNAPIFIDETNAIPFNLETQGLSRLIASLKIPPEIEQNPGVQTLMAGRLPQPSAEASFEEKGPDEPIIYLIPRGAGSGAVLRLVS